MLKLALTSLIEPFLFHPLVVFAAVKGNFQKLFKKKTIWGDMQRKGFTQPD